MVQAGRGEGWCGWGREMEVLKTGGVPMMMVALKWLL